MKKPKELLGVTYWIAFIPIVVTLCFFLPLALVDALDNRIWGLLYIVTTPIIIAIINHSDA